MSRRQRARDHLIERGLKNNHLPANRSTKGVERVAVSGWRRPAIARVAKSAKRIPALAFALCFGF